MCFHCVVSSDRKVHAVTQTEKILQYKPVKTVHFAIQKNMQINHSSPFNDLKSTGLLICTHFNVVDKKKIYFICAVLQNKAYIAVITNHVPGELPH